MHTNQYCNKSSRIVSTFNKCQILTHPLYLKACQLQVLRYFVLEQLLLCQIHFCARLLSFWCIAVIQKFHCAIHLLSRWWTVVYTASYTQRQSSEVHQHNTQTQQLYFSPVCLFLSKTFYSLQPTQVSTVPLQNHAHRHTLVNSAHSTTEINMHLISVMLWFRFYDLYLALKLPCHFFSKTWVSGNKYNTGISVRKRHI